VQVNRKLPQLIVLAQIRNTGAVEMLWILAGNCAILRSMKQGLGDILIVVVMILVALFIFDRAAMLRLTAPARQFLMENKVAIIVASAVVFWINHVVRPPRPID
jgi:hypothetical protein